MGLCVVIQKTDSYQKKKKCETEYLTRYDDLWTSMGRKNKTECTPTQQERFEEKVLDLQQELNVNEQGIYKNDEHFTFPTNYSSIFHHGVFESAYNRYGLNSVAEKYQLPSLYDIFQPPDEAIFQPNWKESLVRARVALQLYIQMESSMMKEGEENPITPYRNRIENIYESIKIVCEHEEQEGFYMVWSS